MNREGGFRSLRSLASRSTLDAVLHLRRTGTLLEAWTRHPIPMDVVTVMTATMMGSIETLVGAIGGSSPQSVFLEVDDRPILVSKVDFNSFLVAIGAPTAGEDLVRRETRRILAQLGPNGGRSVAERAEAHAKA